MLCFSSTSLADAEKDNDSAQTMENRCDGKRKPRMDAAPRSRNLPECARPRAQKRWRMIRPKEYPTRWDVQKLLRPKTAAARSTDTPLRMCSAQCARPRSQQRGT